jgi:hypothetical protein
LLIIKKDYITEMEVERSPRRKMVKSYSPKGPGKPS